MKKSKKIFSLILALVMVFAMTLTASAGTITIKNTQNGETYSFYKIFDVEYDESTGLYTYTITDEKDEDDEYVNAWYEVVSSEEGGAYFTLTAYSYDEESEITTYVVTVTSGYSDNAEGIAEFLASYADKGGGEIDPDYTARAEGSSVSYTAEGNDGYYLVLSSLGTEIILDTTTSWLVYSKNGIPTITKKIKTGTDDNGDDVLEDMTSASIGDTVTFVITVAAKVGAVNYVVTDVLSDGLSYNLSYEYDEEDEGTVVGVKGLSVKVEDDALNYGSDYTVEFDEDGQSFEIEFTETYLNSITEKIKGSWSDEDKEDLVKVDIVITYTATVNSSALTDATENDDGDYVGENTNKVKLSYGNESSVEDIVYVSVFDFDLKKTDETGEGLEGAVFTLKDSEGNTLYFGKTTGSDGSVTYTVDTSVDRETSDDEGNVVYSSSITVGFARIYGLAAGTYTLTETAAPTGYNILTKSIEVTIGDDGSVKIGSETASDETITVVNTSGSELPSTGGMGTTILYIAGIALVLFAGIMLVTRRRMSRGA